jgi:DNA-binding GntR family transcriptional regulator
VQQPKRQRAAETSIAPEGVRGMTASARIQQALRDQIVTMRLKPGTVLSEKELSLTFGVSRTPLREALLRLAEERLVDIFPQMGTFVSRISLPAVRDAMVIRQALERVTAREAAMRAEPADVARLRRIIADQMRFAGKKFFADFHEADEALHQAIADIAGYPNVWRVIKREKAQVDRGRLLMLPQLRRRPIVIDQHQAIVDAIAAANADAAETAMDDHLKDVLPSFVEIQREFPDYFDDGGPEPLPRPKRRRAEGEKERADAPS